MRWVSMKDSHCTSLYIKYSCGNATRVDTPLDVHTDMRIVRSILKVWGSRGSIDCKSMQQEHSRSGLSFIRLHVLDDPAKSKRLAAGGSASSGASSRGLLRSNVVLYKNRRIRAGGVQAHCIRDCTILIGCPFIICKRCKEPV